MRLSIIIPVYNEEKSIMQILTKIKKSDIGNIEKEIILIDDFSSDGTRDLLKNLKGENIKVLFHDKNYGKGKAIRTGLKVATGEFILIQDADLEYDPNDYSKLLKPLTNGMADVVYGSRILNKKNKISSIYFFLGGRLLTFLTNIIYFTNITDEPTCYKVFRKNVLDNIVLKCERFEFCPEVTAKIAKKGITIFEVPISYHPRNKKEGKKIKLFDGIVAIWTLLKYRFID